MSFQDGWGAMNMEMPPRVPRVEFSITTYYHRLMAHETGIKVDENSPEEQKQKAREAFVRQWDYGLIFNALVNSTVFGDKQSHMGHAAFAEGGSDLDYRTDVFVPGIEDVLNFDFYETYGRIDEGEWTRRFEAHYQGSVASYPDVVNMTGIYPSLLTGLTYIFGWETLLEALGSDPVAFGAMTNRYAAWMQQFYNALANANVPVVYSHDDMVWTEGPFCSPAWYREYVFPNIKRYWAPLRESGKKIIFVCDGNYTQFAKDIAACGNTAFWFEIFTDLAYMAEEFGHTHPLIGNADTRILLSGSRGDITGEVKRCLDIGRKCPGYVMAVSNHIPPNTPLEAAVWYNREYMRLRDR